MPSKSNSIRKKEPLKLVLGIKELFYLVLPFLAFVIVLFIVCLSKFGQTAAPSVPTVVDKVTDGVSVYVAVVQDNQHTHTFILSESEYDSINIGDILDIH